MVQVTQARADYSNILPQKNQKIKNFLWRNHEEIGGVLIFLGFVLVFIAAGDTDADVSLFWNISFGILGLATAFTGLNILEPRR